MNKNFNIYALIITLVFAGATHQGYALNSLFNKSHHAGAKENHYHK